MKLLKLSVGIISIGLFTLSCEGVISDDRTETGTKGNIKIGVDKTLEPVMKQQLKVWDSSYPEGIITPEYTSEKEAFQSLFNDSVRLIIVTRDVTENEKKMAEQNKFALKSMAIAKDAVAIITHPEALDKKMTIGMLANILENKFPRKYNIIFDDGNSGLVRLVQDSVIQGRNFDTTKVFAAGTPEKVIEYVANNKDALGIVGINHIYKNDDGSGNPKFINNVNIVALQSESDTTNQYYQPYAAYMALGRYPLTRKIYFVTREHGHGLGNGFINFLAMAPGQTIFKQANMVPLLTQLEIREVLIN